MYGALVRPFEGVDQPSSHPVACGHCVLQADIPLAFATFCDPVTSD